MRDRISLFAAARSIFPKDRRRERRRPFSSARRAPCHRSSGKPDARQTCPRAIQRPCRTSFALPNDLHFGDELHAFLVEDAALDFLNKELDIRSEREAFGIDDEVGVLL